jgi:hypothetical protein
MAVGALNGICPYFTMFPLEFPLSILRTGAKPNQWVLDPFCGRGTTNYASRLLGLPSIGIDSSPVAVAIAKAKLVASGPADILQAAKDILEDVKNPEEVPVGDFWSLAFRPEVLQVLCRLREGFLRDCSSPALLALRAIILGALHGPRTRSIVSYFSNQSQRTCAPKPNYAVGFWRNHRMQPPRVDLLDLVSRRAQRYYEEEPPASKGMILQGDSRDSSVLGPGTVPNRVKWVICSPPYYGLRTYLPDQWLRHWFVGGPVTPQYTLPSDQLPHTTPSIFAEQLRRVWRNVETVCVSGATLVTRFGGINDRKADPLALIRDSFSETNWEIVELRSAGTAARGRRQSLHFSRPLKPPLEEHDLWATYRPSDGTRSEPR